MDHYNQNLIECLVHHCQAILKISAENIDNF